MRQTVIADGKVYALPVVLDHFEFAYRADMFNTGGAAEPESMTEILERAEKLIDPPRRPFICAGAEDAELLLLTGALTEAFLGFPAWKKLVETMKQDIPFTGIIDAELTGGTFRDILNMLVSWKNEGLLHPEWLRTDNSTIAHLMQENLAPSVFMLLSEHRKIPQRTIQRYTAIAIPPRRSEEVRGITAPAVIGMVFPRGKLEKTAGFLNSLVRQQAQRTLSTQTGLAPVNSIAEANDMQASDVRFFAATAEMPIADIGTAAFADPERRAAFARQVRQYLLADGFGY
jgi:ABC-type glycerol-3-phosphate transport system substrate-binding protein